MAYFDNPLIPISQQAPSGMLIGLTDPLDLPNIYSYWNAQVDGSLFTDTSATPINEVTTNGDDVKAWKELTATVNNATESINHPTYGTDGTLKWVEFDGTQLLTVLGSGALFKFMHNGDGGEIIIAARQNVPTSEDFFTLANTNNNSTSTGFSSFISSSPSPFLGAYGFFVSGDSPGQIPADMTQEFGNYIFNKDHVHQASYKETASPEGILELDNINAFEIDFSNGAPPGSGDASNLKLGNVFTRTDGLEGRIYSIAIFDMQLTELARESVSRFLAKSAGFDIGSQQSLFPPNSGYNDFSISKMEDSINTILKNRGISI